MMTDEPTSLLPLTDTNTQALMVGCCVQCGSVQGEEASVWAVFMYCHGCLRKIAEEQGIPVVDNPQDLAKEIEKHEEKNTVDKAEDHAG
jgi:hypothetical protein